MHKKCGVLLLFVAFLANFGVTLALDQASRGVSRLRSLTADTETNDDEERAGNPVLSDLAAKTRPAVATVANRPERCVQGSVSWRG
uniref:Avh349 n=1 Tax=Phytophthora sojae TaxID=67593 RepID=E0W596_PHYSO|nr:Avh349 [Phytophthora sojae]AEK81225.1 Avh349 [Phytophthora sojae]AEK81226.1 Avh349 [Phytophthora sojae]